MTQRIRRDCWEYQGCERGPQGRRSRNGHGCPAAASGVLDGTNGGTNGGRACWVVADTLCGDRPSGPYERKIHECRKCSFYALVHVEEGLAEDSSGVLAARLRSE